MGADLVTCILYTKAVARFPLRYLGFLVFTVNVIYKLLVCLLGGWLLPRIKMVYISAESPIQVVTGPSVEQLLYRYTLPPPCLCLLKRYVW